MSTTAGMGTLCFAKAGCRLAAASVWMLCGFSSGYGLPRRPKVRKWVRGPGHRYHVFVRKQFKEDGKTLLGRGSLAEEIKKQSGIDSDDMKEVLCRAAVDVRLFGAVYSVSKSNFQ